MSESREVQEGFIPVLRNPDRLENGFKNPSERKTQVARGNGSAHRAGSVRQGKEEMARNLESNHIPLTPLHLFPILIEAKGAFSPFYLRRVP